MTRLRCAVGVLAHDEAGMIARAVRALLAQRVDCAEVEVVAVISSGSRDATDAIVEGLCGEDARLQLLRQPRRLGKISGINHFLASFPGRDVYVVSNADVVLEPGALGRLLRPFGDGDVGMTGGRVVPYPRAGRPHAFLDFADALTWDLHHRIALKRPKLGETVAFRPIAAKLPLEAIADEAYLEGMAAARGLRRVYVPEAIVRNTGPSLLRELFAVRRRNAAAHAALLRRGGHRVATWHAPSVVFALRDRLRDHVQRAYGAGAPRGAGPQALRDLRRSGWLAGLIALELAARSLGWCDALFAPRRHVLWRMARSARVDYGRSGLSK